MTKTQGTEGKCPRNSGERESRVGVSREKCHRLLAFLSIPSAQRAPWDQDVCGRRDLDPLSGPSLALRTGRPKWRETSDGFSLPPMRWRVQKSARGEEAQVHGPPRCVPPPASPPLRPREKRPRAPLRAVGLEDAAEAERGGQRTRCERGRCGPLCWCWGRWRASASEVSEAPARRGRSSPVSRAARLAAAKCADFERGNRAGGSCAAALRVRGTSLGLSEPGAGDLPGPAVGKARGYLGVGAPGHRSP